VTLFFCTSYYCTTHFVVFVAVVFPTVYLPPTKDWYNVLLVSVCLSVCLSAKLLKKATNGFWWNFARSFLARNLDEFVVGGQNPMTSFPVLHLFTPVIYVQQDSINLLLFDRWQHHNAKLPTEWNGHLGGSLCSSSSLVLVLYSVVTNMFNVVLLYLNMVL